jgi:hypothetical protein
MFHYIKKLSKYILLHQSICHRFVFNKGLGGLPQPDLTWFRGKPFQQAILGPWATLNNNMTEQWLNYTTNARIIR